jgi:hypothetical protein
MGTEMRRYVMPTSNFEILQRFTRMLASWSSLLRGLHFMDGNLMRFVTLQAAD